MGGGEIYTLLKPWLFPRDSLHFQLLKDVFLSFFFFFFLSLLVFSLEEELLGPKQKVKTCRIFFLSLFFALILKHTPSIVQYSCCIPTANKRFGCAARGEQKVTVNFCVGERLSQTMKFFFFFPFYSFRGPGRAPMSWSTDWLFV